MLSCAFLFTIGGRSLAAELAWGERLDDIWRAALIINNDSLVSIVTFQSAVGRRYRQVGNVEIGPLECPVTGAVAHSIRGRKDTFLLSGEFTLVKNIFGGGIKLGKVSESINMIEGESVYERLSALEWPSTAVEDGSYEVMNRKRLLMVIGKANAAPSDCAYFGPISEREIDEVSVFVKTLVDLQKKQFDMLEIEQIVKSENHYLGFLGLMQASKNKSLKAEMFFSLSDTFLKNHFGLLVDDMFFCSVRRDDKLSGSIARGIISQLKKGCVSANLAVLHRLIELVKSNTFDAKAILSSKQFESDLTDLSRDSTNPALHDLYQQLVSLLTLAE
jgi:hypothetical protein